MEINIEAHYDGDSDEPSYMALYATAATNEKRLLLDQETHIVVVDAYLASIVVPPEEVCSVMEEDPTAELDAFIRNDTMHFAWNYLDSCDVVGVRQDMLRALANPDNWVHKITLGHKTGLWCLETGI
jgi:hypothetical protein